MKHFLTPAGDPLAKWVPSSLFVSFHPQILTGTHWACAGLGVSRRGQGWIRHDSVLQEVTIYQARGSAHKHLRSQVENGTSVRHTTTTMELRREESSSWTWDMQLYERGSLAWLLLTTPILGSGHQVWSLALLLSRCSPLSQWDHIPVPLLLHL